MQHDFAPDHGGNGQPKSGGFPNGRCASDKNIIAITPTIPDGQFAVGVISENITTNIEANGAYKVSIHFQGTIAALFCTKFSYNSVYLCFYCY